MALLEGAFDSSRKIQKEVKAIGHLLGARRAQLRTFHIDAATIPTELQARGIFQNSRRRH
jgi:hypothetical protein